jgi:hypothetical protein
MKRALGAILAGLLAAVVLIAAVSFAAHSMYAPAQPIDPNDAKAVESFVSTLPVGAFALILAGWGIATFAGAFLAARLGRSAVYGFVIGAAVLIFAVAHMLMAPHPYWVWGAGIVIVVVTALVAVRSALPARGSAA